MSGKPKSEDLQVNVGQSVDGGLHHATIVDVPGGRAWSGEGSTSGEAATEAVRKFVSDRRAREYLP